MRRFGLIGKNISYSFSPGYFKSKFESLGLRDCSYEIFDLSDITQFTKVAIQSDLCGLNVTIPYKTAIIDYLDRLDPDAQEIGAVNTLKFTQDGIVGYNTDVIGFTGSLSPLLQPGDTAALILGTGGASMAIAYGLTQLGIQFKFVSRSPKKDNLSYAELDSSLLNAYQLIINCTPLGTFPRLEEAPPIPYPALNKRHLLYDLIYNPEQTRFLKEGRKQGCRVKNGLEMLHLQAEASWNIWNS